MDLFFVHVVISAEVRDLNEGKVKGLRAGGWRWPRRIAEASYSADSQYQL